MHFLACSCPFNPSLRGKCSLVSVTLLCNTTPALTVLPDCNAAALFGGSNRPRCVRIPLEHHASSRPRQPACC